MAILIKFSSNINDRSFKFSKFDNTDFAKEKLLPPAKFDILFVTDVNIGYINFSDIP